MERTEENTRLSAPDRDLQGSYLDWPAIFGGGVVAVAVASVFTGFGAALGLSTISAEPGEGSFNLMLIVSALWVVVSLVASYMAGGYIAGRMRRRVDSAGADEVTIRDGINGLVVWGLGIVVTVVMLGSAVSTTVSAVGSVASGAATVAGGVADATGAVVGTAAEGVASTVASLVPDEAMANPVDYLNRTLLRPDVVGTPPATTAGTTTATGTPAAFTSDPAEIAAETASILGNVLLTGEISDAERAYLVSAAASVPGITRAEAETRVETAITATQTARTEADQVMTDTMAQAEQLAEDARNTAIDAAEAARVSAILTAFLLAAAAIVAAAAAYIGSVLGGRHRDEGRIFGGFAYRG